MSFSIRIAKLGIFGAMAIAAGTASAATTVVTVDGQSGPWSVAANPTLVYGTSGALAPTVMSSGFSFAAGGTFTFAATGSVTAGSGPVFGVPNGPDGNPGYSTTGNSGSSGMGFPSAYFAPRVAPYFLTSLVGAFADASGQVVGTPFEVGSALTIAAPAGASQLLLGINDDIFYDNGGAFTVAIDGPDPVTPVPEPAAWAMLVGGVGLVGGSLRMRRRKVTFATA